MKRSASRGVSCAGFGGEEAAAVPRQMRWLHKARSGQSEIILAKTLGA